MEFEIKALLKGKEKKLEEERVARFKARGRDPGPPWNPHDNLEIVQFDRKVSTNNDNCTCPVTIFHGSALAISLAPSFFAFVCFFFDIWFLSTPRARVQVRRCAEGMEIDRNRKQRAPCSQTQHISSLVGQTNVCGWLRLARGHGTTKTASGII